MSLSTPGSLLGVETAGTQIPRVNRCLSERRPGDMIRIARIGFLHYAIYIGADMIVDFVDDNGGEVSTRNLYETVRSSACAVDNYLDKKLCPYSEDEIVQRALMETLKKHTYKLGTYNCEHFATWCRYGIECCRQPCLVAASLGVNRS